MPVAVALAFIFGYLLGAHRWHKRCYRTIERIFEGLS